MNLRKIPLQSIALAFALAVSGIARAETPNAKCRRPETPKRDVTDAYHGMEIVDPYRWLENTSDPETKSWTEAQNTYARCYLAKLPQVDKIRSKLQAWNGTGTATYRELIYRGGTYFALKLQPPKNQSMLVALSTPDDSTTERVVLDPNLIDSSGTTAIDFFSPSLDGKFVAVSLSKGGSEEGTLHIYQTQDGKELQDLIPLVNKPTAGGSVTWDKDGTGIYYTRYPAPAERSDEDRNFYQQIYYHKIGAPISEDTYSLGKDFPRIAEIQLQTSDYGSYILATVANGDGGEFAHYVLPENPEKGDHKWIQITRFSDQVKQARLGQNGDLFLVSIAGSPKGKVLRLALDQNPKLENAKLVVGEGSGVVTEILPTDSRLYVDYMIGGPSEIHVFDLSGGSLGTLKMPLLSDVSDLSRVTGNSLVFRSQSYVRPMAWYEYRSPMSASAGEAKETLEPKQTVLVTQSPVDFSDIEVKRENARSKDGTEVPLTILYKKGTKRTGKNPTLLYGYGGYGISLTPRFNQDLHLWLESGGVYAIANLRGGAEFGEAWHLAGNLTHKQNVFDDFIACAEHLIQAKYTNKSTLAIEGGSNGGLLMGAALTQRPDLFHAVVSHVGIYDMLRVELDPNGAFNVTEFGSVKNTDQFHALYGYSPYHHVKAHTAYPAILLLTGANDGRVNPYHSKKMAALLQASTSSGKPVLLRVTFDGGHGIGRSVTQKVSEETDVYAFLFQQLGMKLK